MSGRGAALHAAAGFTEGVPESRALTGLRGVAAVMVLLHHLALHYRLTEVLPLGHWMASKGYLGVDLFFVLSGFVLSMVYGPWFDGRGPVALSAWARFLLRRVARLWPLHVATLGIALLLMPWHPGIPPYVSWHVVAANLVMVQGWGLSASVNPPSWSVSTEFAAYLLFPLLALLGLRRRPGAVLCLAVALALILASILGAPPRGPGRRGLLDLYFNYSLLPLMRCLADFILGMLAWRLGRRPAVRLVARWPGTMPVLLLGTAALIVARANDLVILALMPLLVLSLHFGSGPAQRVLARGPMRVLGLLSFAIYLLHFPLMGLFPPGLLPLAVLLPCYAASVLAGAAVLYLVVEEPGRAALRRAGEAVLAALDRRPGRGGPPLQDAARWPK